MDKPCYSYLVQCNQCHGLSMHLSFLEIPLERISPTTFRFKAEDDELESYFFYSIPDVSLSIHPNIPRQFRQLLSETESCLKQGLLTGASACLRKLAGEMAREEDLIGKNYKANVALLKSHMPHVDPTYFDAILTIVNASSDTVQEQSHDAWSANQIRLMLSSFLAILFEFYVIPSIQESRNKDISSFRREVHEILFPEETK